MKATRYPVQLRQVTTIRDGAMKEEVVLEAIGTLFETKDGYALKFIQADEQPIETMIKWSEDQVALIRKGHVVMHHVFAIGKQTRSLYDSQFGQMWMSAVTDSIEMGDERMAFAYQLEMDEQPVGSYMIEITWKRSDENGI